MKYGYARVSATDQNLDRQLHILEVNEGINRKNIYCDKASGKNFDRPKWQKLLKKLKPGDLLVIVSLDRLGRNYQEMGDMWRKLTKELKVDVKVYDMPLLDTTWAKDSLGQFIADLVFQLLSYMAEAEREKIHERQRQGIEVAKQKGVKFGRPAIPIPAEFLFDCKSNELSRKQMANKYNVSESTICRWIKRSETMS